MRQVHLDFHTAGAIDDVGADWNAEAFVETLQRAHVDSVTLFALPSWLCLLFPHPIRDAPRANV